MEFTNEQINEMFEQIWSNIPEVYQNEIQVLLNAAGNDEEQIMAVKRMVIEEAMAHQDEIDQVEGTPQEQAQELINIMRTLTSEVIEAEDIAKAKIQEAFFKETKIVEICDNILGQMANLPAEEQEQAQPITDGLTSLKDSVHINDLEAGMQSISDNSSNLANDGIAHLEAMHQQMFGEEA